MDDQLEDMQITLVDDDGRELIVIENIDIQNDPSESLATVKLEYKTIEGETVFCDRGDFTYRDKHYTLKSEI